MSFKVVDQVLDRSRARGTDRLVMIALAECAHHDGVTWIPIGNSEFEPMTICGRARCSKREAIRAVGALRDELREIETRKVRRGRSFITVYRVVVGAISFQPILYDKIPFQIVPPFLQGDDLARWTEGYRATVAAEPSSDPATVQGDDLAPSTGPFTVPGATVQGAICDAFTVPPSRARVEREPSENQVPDPARAGAREPASSESPDREQLLADPRLMHVREFVERTASLADRVEIGPRLDGVNGNLESRHRRALLDRVDELRGETAAEAYARWIDEKAADHGFPLDEIAVVVATWDDLDDVSRQDYLDRAAAIRGHDEGRQAKERAA